MRKILRVLLFMLICVSAQAQTFFNRCSSNAYLMSELKMISDGNLLCGFADANHAYICKQDSVGVQIWNTRIPLLYPQVMDIEEAADGAILALVYAYYSSTNPSSYVIRLNANGQFDWMKIYHANTTDQHCDIQAMPDTGFAMVGAGCSGTNYLLRARKDGSIRWQKTYFDPNNTAQFAFQHLLLTDGGSTFTITGNTSAYGITLFRCDTAGNFMWNREYYAGVSLFVWGIAPTYNGFIISLSHTQFTSTNSYSRAGALRVDNSGNVLFMTRYEFGYETGIGPVVELPDHSLIFGGATKNPADTTARIAMLMGTDEYCLQLWTQSFSDSVMSAFGVQGVNSIVPGNNQTVYLNGGGYFNYFARFSNTGYGACAPIWQGPSTVYLQPNVTVVPSVVVVQPPIQAYADTVACDDGLFISMYTSCNNIITDHPDVNSAEQWEMGLPANGLLEVTVPSVYNGQPVTFEIIDLSGKTVLTENNSASPGKQQINVAQLPTGLFLLKASKGNELLFSKCFMLMR